ncbi:MAG: aminopeptidase [Clostridiales bacterium]|nr:aminopeptidase [Clostridiales bacterium]
MNDSRIDKLADILINYSCQLKEGQNILIEATGIPYEMVNALIEKTYSVGAYPFVEIYDNKIKHALLSGMTKELATRMQEFDARRMEKMHAYIGIRGGNNSMELADIDKGIMQTYAKYYSYPVHHELRVNKTNWVVLRWPTEGMAQLAKMSTKAFEDFYFDVCTLDYGKMDKAMNPLEELMKKTDKVRITAKDTDLTFSIKGIGAQKCAGQRNIPDGEIYTAPVKDSVNGYVHYNAPSIENGMEFKDVRLEFKDGKIIKATSSDTTACNKIFDTDEGSRYIGEFAIGVNPYITKPMGDILFDEKISGSIHFTPGSCYEDCDNGNQSAVHWDLVLIQTPEYGGGEIYFDDVLIRKDGRFVLPQLLCLNPENLK